LIAKAANMVLATIVGTVTTPAGEVGTPAALVNTPAGSETFTDVSDAFLIRVSFQQNRVDRAKDMLPLWMSAVITRAAMALMVRAPRLSQTVSGFRKMSPHGISRPSVGVTRS
jgi:hypothetical protein